MAVRKCLPVALLFFLLIAANGTIMANEQESRGPAFVNNGSMASLTGPQKQIIHTPNAPAAIGPYSQAIRAGQTLYISGQLGMVPASGEFKSAADGEQPIRAQTEQALQNIGEILKAAGASFDDVLKTTILLVDMAHFPVVNEVYAKFFNEQQGFPARACYQVSALPKGGLVEIEAIAALP